MNVFVPEIVANMNTLPHRRNDGFIEREQTADMEPICRPAKQLARGGSAK
jgi:hypothetical protein